MGLNDAKRSQREDKQRAAAEAKRKRQSRTEASGTADWGNADPVLLARAVCAITRDGGAIRLGYTRDGGAFAVGIYENGTAETEYVKPNEDLNVYLQGIIDDYAK